MIIQLEWATVAGATFWVAVGLFVACVALIVLAAIVNNRSKP